VGGNCSPSEVPRRLLRTHSCPELGLLSDATRCLVRSAAICGDYYPMTK
jgi:hypothetical protein